MKDNRVTVAWEADGGLEYLTDRNGAPLIFESQAAAELRLLQDGIPGCDLEYLLFNKVAA